MPLARTFLLYGESGSTKTSQLYHFARHYLATHPNMRIRLISADGGGWSPFEDSGMIASGQVQAMNIANRHNAFADIKRLAEGYWPRVGLPTPRDEDFKFSDNLRTSPAEWGGIGMYIIEGMTSIGRLLLNHLGNDNNLPLALRPSYVYQDDEYVFSGGSEGHYGTVQREMYKVIVQGFNTLPVDYVLYSALVEKGEEKRTTRTIYGPQCAGQKLTGEIPSWVGDCLHLSWETYKVAQLDSNGKTVLGPDDKPQAVDTHGPVVWMFEHEDKLTGIPYLCKVRVLPERVEEVRKRWRNGYALLGAKKGITTWFDEIQRINRREQAQVAQA